MNPIRRRAALIAASAALALGLAGCAGAPSIQQADAAAFRAQVVSVAELAQTGDLAGAVASLDQLTALVDAAVADGRLGTERETQIRESSALVRADLEAAIAQVAADQGAATEPAPAPAPVEGDDDDDGGEGDDGEGNGNEGNSDQGNGNQGNGNQGNGNQGNGNQGNGNQGNGNSGNGDSGSGDQGGGTPPSTVAPPSTEAPPPATTAPDDGDDAAGKSKDKKKP